MPRDCNDGRSSSSPPRTHPTFEGLFRDALGSLALLQGDADGAIRIFEGVLEDATRLGDVFVESVTLANLGWARLARGEARPDLFARHLELSLQLGNEDGVGFALEGLAACAAASDDIERAGLLLGAGETARLRTGLVDQRSFLTYRPFVDRILASDRAADFEAARVRGRGCRARRTRPRARAGGIRFARCPSRVMDGDRHGPDNGSMAGRCGGIPVTPTSRQERAVDP